MHGRGIGSINIPIFMIIFFSFTKDARNLLDSRVLVSKMWHSLSGLSPCLHGGIGERLSSLNEGSRESAPTNNRKFTSDKRKQPQGKWACGRAFAGARLRARVCGRAFFAQRALALSSQPGYKRCIHNDYSQLN